MLSATGGTLNLRPFIIQVAKKHSDIVFRHMDSETRLPLFAS